MFRIGRADRSVRRARGVPRPARGAIRFCAAADTPRPCQDRFLASPMSPPLAESDYPAVTVTYALKGTLAAFPLTVPNHDRYLPGKLGWACGNAGPAPR